MTFNWACCVRVFDLFERMCFQIERRPPLIERAMFSLWTHLGLCERPYCSNFILCVCKFGAQRSTAMFTFTLVSHTEFCALTICFLFYIFLALWACLVLFLCALFMLFRVFTHIEFDLLAFWLYSLFVLATISSSLCFTLFYQLVSWSCDQFARTNIDISTLCLS